MTIWKQADETFGKGTLLEKEAEFENAKAIYEDLLRHATDDAVLGKVGILMADIDDLIAEKAIYRRIDENAKRVLTKIGTNIIESPPLNNMVVPSNVHQCCLGAGQHLEDRRQYQSSRCDSPGAVRFGIEPQRIAQVRGTKSDV